MEESLSMGDLFLMLFVKELLKWLTKELDLVILVEHSELVMDVSPKFYPGKKKLNILTPKIYIRKYFLFTKKNFKAEMKL